MLNDFTGFPQTFSDLWHVLRVNMFSFVKNTGHRWICQFCWSMANVTWAQWSQAAKKGPIRARQDSCLDFFMFYCEFDPLLYFWISGFGAYLIPVPGENFQVVCVPVLLSLHYSKLSCSFCVTNEFSVVRVKLGWKIKRKKNKTKTVFCHL